MNVKPYLSQLLVILSVMQCLVECQDSSDKETDKKIKKLQIGVKKRVENCDRKSSKGDILHIHYKVCQCFCCPLTVTNCPLLLGHSSRNGRRVRQFVQKRPTVDIHIRYGTSDRRMGSGIARYVRRREEKTGHSVRPGLWVSRSATDDTARRGPRLRS